MVGVSTSVVRGNGTNVMTELRNTVVRVVSPGQKRVIAKRCFNEGFSGEACTTLSTAFVDVARCSSSVSYLNFGNAHQVSG
jgi:hypothetical protein